MSVTFMTFLSSELISSMMVPNYEDYIDDYSDVLRFKGVRLNVEPDSIYSNMLDVCGSFINPKRETDFS